MLELDSASTPLHLTVAFIFASSTFAMISWLFNWKQPPARLPTPTVSLTPTSTPDLVPAPTSALSPKPISTATPSEVTVGSQQIPKMAFKSFRKKLNNGLVATRLQGFPQKFLPASTVTTLVTTQTVGSILPDATSEVIDFICSHAAKIFLTTLSDGGMESDLGSFMEACHTHGMTDELLPIDQDMGCIDDATQCRQNHHQALNVFHRYYLSEFAEKQHAFLSPIFTSSQFKYILKAGCVLPMQEGSDKGSDGHFSTVFEAWVHHDHHDVHISQKDPRGLRVALKKLKSLTSEPGYKVENAWEHEATALQKISGLRHKNLIRPMAAIQCGSEFYIMFEWADGGSLRTLWQSQGDEPQDLDADRVMCFLEEISGLAGALAALHNTNRNTKTARAANFAVNFSNSNSKIAKAVPIVATTDTNSNPPRAIRRAVTFADSPSITPTAQIPEIYYEGASDDDASYLSDDGSRSFVSDDSDLSQVGDEHWRHGDLKPDNILKVIGSGPDAAFKWLGTLKIADLGLAKQHMFATRRRNDQTNMQYTTSQYEAPEANRYMGTSNLPRSRRFDIWSMGCVLIEFAIVLLYGNKGLAAFYAESKNLNQGTQTLYFTVDPKIGRAEVSSVVTHWIEHILNDPECQRPQSAIGDVVRFVRDRLLVVEVPVLGMSASEIEKCRADAAELQERLEDIWEKARDDEQNKGNYLFATKNRSQMPLPALRLMRPSSNSAPSGQEHLGDNLLQQQRRVRG